MKFTTIPGLGFLRRATVRVPAPLAATLLAVFLAGCGAGSVTPQVNPPAPNSSGATTSNYNGVAPASADVQAFKVAFWDNVSPQNRCGACHVQNNQQPSFARNDDINLAYQAAQSIVDLSNPSNSRVVTKVAGGHHCWLTNNQACADAITTWIRNWAGTANTGSAAQVQLVAPPVIDPGQSRTFPTDPTLFGSTVHPLLRQYCARCHAPTAASPQAPYFAQTNVGQAYEASKPKINLDVTTLSRFYVRLKEESHHCWGGDCNAAAAEMLAALNAFRNGVPLTSIDPSFVLSKALTLYDGTVASGGNRVESGLIAKFEFKTGTGTVAYDTSGVEPAVNLNLSGDVQWVGGWGVRVANRGKLQGTTTGSVKLLNRIKASGEYSVEAWVAPANVTQEDAYIVSYSGGAAARNFTLGQNLYDYDFMNRSSLTNANGMPAVSTPSAQRLAQATLQHVVLTYGPVNGRRIYVNGRLVNVADGQRGGNLNDWDDTFALVLGNEVSGDRPWSGILKMVAIYDRALDLPAIQTNYAAGVGERYYLLFNIEQIVNVPKAYVLFEVSQFDSYAYLFDKPTFLSLDATARPGSIPLKGMRIGLNGAEPKAGQSYIPLDLTITDAGYDSTKGFPLSAVGAVVPLEKGPAYDQFFLTFERLGSRTNVRTEPVPVAPAPVNVARSADIGVRSFERVNATLSAITGVPTTQTAVATLFENVKQALPTTENFQGFVGSHQTAIAQLSIQYCAVMVDDATLRGAFFPGVNVAAPLDAAAKTVVVNQLVAKALNSGTTVLGTQPNPAAVQTELNALMDKLAQRGASTPTILKAACAAVTGSAGMLVQ
jgi:mono/diheme cytochrome c family protein